MRDYQRQRVYNWENKNIAKKVSTKPGELDFMKKIVNYIWKDLGCECPPEVHINHGKFSSSTGGRYEIVFAPHMVNEFVTIHELAHSFNQRNDYEDYDHHGPNFVADYCFLLNKYYQVDENYLIGTLSESKVDINLARYYEHKRKHG